MIKACAVRILGAAPVILLVICGVFALIHLAPGDAAAQLAPDEATDADVAQLRALWGLDQPLYVQLGKFIYNVARLNLGVSLRYQQSNLSLIEARLPATLELALVAMLLATAIGIPAGLLAALHKGRIADAFVSILSVAGVSAPSFWLALLLVLQFSSRWGLLPSGGRLPFGAPTPSGTGFLLIDSLAHGDFGLFRIALAHLVLPAATLAAGMVGIIARITRSAVIDVAQEEFIVTAVAKGLSRTQIVRRHVVPNAAIPIVTIIGLELGVMISGTIIVEVVFSWPGVGNLLYEAVTVRDTPLVTSVVIVYSALFIFLNVLIDLFYLSVDPRVRTSVAEPA
jgi:ABC-type dipeptide/oligopeptide/nickel transport system permease component